MGSPEFTLLEGRATRVLECVGESKLAKYRTRIARPSVSSFRRDGFTLVELLVVIAVVGILAGLLLPVLGQAKSKGHAIFCLNSERQLTLAWHIYADEHDGRVAPNFGIAETQQEIANGTYRNWVNNVLSWGLEPDNTNRALIFAGGLGPYLSGVDAVYRCPTDFVLSTPQQQAGWNSRVRSLSMNAMIGDAGVFTAGGFNTNNPNYRQFFTITEIPQPSEIFVFIEEHPDTIKDGYFLHFLNHPYSGEWGDLPASYHNGAANIAFADGHVELHKWLDGSTRKPARTGAVPFPWRLNSSERADFNWITHHMSERRY